MSPRKSTPSSLPSPPPMLFNFPSAFDNVSVRRSFSATFFFPVKTELNVLPIAAELANKFSMLLPKIPYGPSESLISVAFRRKTTSMFLPLVTSTPVLVKFSFLFFFLPTFRWRVTLTFRKPLFRSRTPTTKSQDLFPPPPHPLMTISF